MKDILIATYNRGKAKEIEEIFQGSDFNPRFLFEFDEVLEIIEDADTFTGNAQLKARIAGDHFGLLSLGDDSGLEVEALDGQPGVYSARYAGTGNDRDNISKLLNELEGVPLEERNARYVCAVAIYDPRTKVMETVFGAWEGKIALKPCGDKSFGYAPIFLAADFDYQSTNAEHDPKELMAINHRGQAFRRAIEFLQKGSL